MLLFLKPLVCVRCIQTQFKTKQRKMNHPFLSRRAELDRLRHSSQAAEDVLAILTLTPKDKALLLGRRDDEIQDTRARDAVMRHSHHLGTVLRVVDDSLADQFTDAWRTFVTTPGNHTVPATLCNALDQRLSALAGAIKEIECIEHDSGSSSYSDYSDSHTETSDEDDDESSSSSSSNNSETPRSSE